MTKTKDDTIKIGTQILKDINSNISIYTYKKEEISKEFGEVIDIIIEKNRKERNFYSYSFDFPYIITIFDYDKNVEFFEKFYRKNYKITENFSKEDLKNKIFHFLAKNPSNIIDKNLISELKQIKETSFIMVAMIRGLSVDKEESFGNFKIKLLKYKDIENIYSSNSLFKNTIESGNEMFKEYNYYFLEYHTKVRVVNDDDFKPSNHIDKLREIYEKKFKQLSLVLNFLYKKNYDNKNEKIRSLDISLYNILPDFLDNHIAIFEDSINNDKLKANLSIKNSSSNETPLRLSLDGEIGIRGVIISSEIDEELIKLIDKEKSGLETNIFQAILWAGKSIVNDDLEEAFVQLFIGLEALCMDKHISDFVAYYLGEKLDERLQYRAIIKDLHNKRSRIIHQNSFGNIIEYVDYYNLLDIVKKIIYKMYKNLCLIKTKEDLEKYIEELRYS